MTKKIAVFSLLFLLFAGVATSQVALAVEQPPTEFRIPTTNVTSGKDFLDILEAIVNWIFAFIIVGAVVFIVLAGWQLISAGGEPQAVAQARNKLLWAAVGIGVAVLSRGIIAAIRGIIGT